MGHDKNFVIAIDGPSASGKGTLACKLAAALDFAHMDTGALYRAVAFEVLEKGGDPENEEQALEGSAALRQKLENGPSILKNESFRNDVVADGASKIAQFQAVRDALLGIQRDFACSPGPGYAGSILDGRDIGTVVCPDAPIKLFITANTEIRAQRRTKELQSKGIDATYNSVLADMRERDSRDSSRKAAPLRPAHDAIVLDSTTLSEEQMLGKALNIVKDVRAKAGFHD